MQQLTTLLSDIGLTDKEAQLYLASLSLGEAGMAELARHAKLKRTTAYLIFQSLEAKGLIGSFQMKRGTRFVATPPGNLLRQAEERTDKVRQLIPELKAILPKAEQAPRIAYYEGKEGYLVATEESLQLRDTTIRHIGSLKELHEVVTYEYDTEHYIPGRLRNRIFLRALYFASEFSPEIKAHNDAEELREIRTLPEKFAHPTSTLIYGNKVVIFSSEKELVTVIIESPAIAEAEKKKFDLIWQLIGDPKRQPPGFEPLLT